MQNQYDLPGGLRRGARYDSIFYGAYAGETATFDIRVRFHFKRRLNPALLQKAADEALLAYPEFAVRPVIYKGRICYRQNDRHVRICDDDGKKLYFGTDGPDGTNGYLFVFLLRDKTLTLSLFHGLTDARGMIAYIVTVLWNYLREVFLPARWMKPLYFEKFGIRFDRHMFDEMQDTERYDPLVHFAKPGDPVDLIDTARLFRLPPEPDDAAAGTCRLLNLEISNEQFLQKTKQLGTSFAPLLAALTARAVAGLADVGDRIISVVTTVDGRRLLPTNSLGNMAYNCPLPVEKQDLSLPLAELCRKLREDMRSQVTAENAAKTYSFILRQCDEIDAMGDIRDVNAALTGPNGLKTLTTNGTLFLTYPGKVGNNAISRVLLESVTPGMLAMERAIVVYSHRDSMIVQLTQKSDDMSLILALRRELEKEGFAPRLHDLGRITQNVLALSKLPVAAETEAG